MFDPGTGALRKTWAFVMTLADSRHQYVECVLDQALLTWIALHGHAFTFVGGVPHRVVLDHLKAGIVHACFDDPQVQSTYRECAEPDGFLLAPCRPRTPSTKARSSRAAAIRSNGTSWARGDPRSSPRPMQTCARGA